MSSKKNNTKKATTTSVKDAVVANDSTAEVTEVTEPVAEVTEPVAEVTEPVVEETAPKSSLSIGRTEEESEFLKFEHPDKRILQFKVAKGSQIGVYGSIWTPERFLIEGNEGKLLDFANNHPRYFIEVFE